MLMNFPLTSITAGFVMEAGKDKKTDSVLEYDENERGCRWHTNKSYAVVTCLHKKIFKKPKRREWFNEKEQKEMRHMTRGRILWTDVMTHTGRWMRVVNVHQATSKDKVLQGVVLKALEHQLGRHENVMGIMGGDFNANANGDRTGYAESNKQHLDGVDRQFEDFAIRTG